MLFDLQSGKRRRVVQVVFGTLAVIFAVSFVFFGVGSEVGSGLSDIWGSGGGGDENPFDEDINDAEDRLAANPADTAALAELVGLRYQAGTRLLEVDTETGTTALTSDAEEEFQRGADAWDRMLKVTKGQNVDTSAALLAVQTFATLGQGLIGQAASGSGEPALADADDAITAFKSAGEAAAPRRQAARRLAARARRRVLLPRRRHRRRRPGRPAGPRRRHPEAARAAAEGARRLEEAGHEAERADRGLPQAASRRPPRARPGPRRTRSGTSAAASAGAAAPSPPPSGIVPRAVPILARPGR